MTLTFWRWPFDHDLYLLTLNFDLDPRDPAVFDWSLIWLTAAKLQSLIDCCNAATLLQILIECVSRGLYTTYVKLSYVCGFYDVMSRSIDFNSPFKCFIDFWDFLTQNLWFLSYNIYFLLDASPLLFNIAYLNLTNSSCKFHSFYILTQNLWFRQIYIQWNMFTQTKIYTYSNYFNPK